MGNVGYVLPVNANAFTVSVAIGWLWIVGPVCAQVEPGYQSATFEVDGAEREYLLYVPAAYQNGARLPVVLNLHGTSLNPTWQMDVSELAVLAEGEKFLVVAPAATYLDRGRGRVTWNADLDPDGLDDVEFIKRLIDELDRTVRIDRARIFVTGFSGGGRMASRLGCELGLIIAAIAPVAGLQFPEDCKPGRSVPVITFHGTADPYNHYFHRDTSPAYWKVGVEKSTSSWAESNGCDQKPDEDQVTNEVVRFSYKNCRAIGDVVLYRLGNGGHTWPGSSWAAKSGPSWMGYTNEDVEASRLMWEFFEQHPLSP